MTIQGLMGLGVLWHCIYNLIGCWVSDLGNPDCHVRGNRSIWVLKIGPFSLRVAPTAETLILASNLTIWSPGTVINQQCDLLPWILQMNIFVGLLSAYGSFQQVSQWPNWAISSP